MFDLILYLLFLIMGIAIGYNLREKPKADVPKDIQKLEQELVVYKNLKESLLQDVRYWRSRAENKDV